MNIKSIAIAAAAIIATGCTAMNKPTASCSKASCSKKEGAVEQPHASCSKKDASCAANTKQ